LIDLRTKHGIDTPLEELVKMDPAKEIEGYKPRVEVVELPDKEMEKTVD